VLAEFDVLVQSC